MKIKYIFYFLFFLLATYIIFYFVLPKGNKIEQPRGVTFHKLGYTFNELTYPNDFVNFGIIYYKLSINDEGTYQHFISNDGANFDTVVYEYGPNARFFSTQYLLDNGADLDITYGGNCVTAFPSNSPKWTSALWTFNCLMSYANILQDDNYVGQLLYNTCTILATSSVRENLNEYNMVQTYMGLGILIKPRGSVLTPQQFTVGFTPLFGDIGMQRCGQLDVNFNKYVHCGLDCYLIAQDPQEDPPVIWELSSPNEKFKIQFFDNGLVRFSKMDATNNPIRPYFFSTSVSENPNCTYPRCVPLSKPTDLVDLTLVGLFLDIRRDKWIMRNASFLYESGTIQYTSIAQVDLIVQLSDDGAIMLQKDYVYNNSTSHPMIQSGVTASYPGIILGDAPKNDYPFNPSPGNSNEISLNYHWQLGNILTCLGLDYAANWELNNGTTVAKTAIDNISNGKRYILWLSHFGLRLFYCTHPIQAINLKDWANCIWLTPVYNRWFYLNGLTEYVPNVWGANTCPNPIPLQYATNPIVSTMPAPPNIGGALSLITNPVPLTTIRSPNKKYLFQMLNNGVCEFINTNNL